MPYVRRDEPWPRNFPTLLAAKCGKDKGLVFASTMMLAATRQTPLIRAMLCAHSQVADLPEPGVVRRVAGRYGPKLTTGLLAGLTLFLLAPEDKDTLQWVLISGLVTLGATVVLDLLPWLWRSTHRVVRALAGA